MKGEEEIKSWRNLSESLKKKLSKLDTKENYKIRRQIGEAKKEAQKLKEELYLLKSNNNSKDAIVHKKKIEELLNKEAELNHSILIKAMEAKNKESPSKDIVTREEVTLEVHELKLSLIGNSIKPETIREEVLIGFENTDTISIHELSRLLKRKPLECKLNTLKVARYLIEARSDLTITFNELSGERVSTVIDNMKKLLGEYTVFDEDTERSTWKSIVNVQFVVIE